MGRHRDHITKLEQARGGAGWGAACPCRCLTPTMPSHACLPPSGPAPRAVAAPRAPLLPALLTPLALF